MAQTNVIRNMDQSSLLLSLPAELRVHILHYVFEDAGMPDGFVGHGFRVGVQVDEDYTAERCLRPLLTCRQFHRDAGLLAFERTSFLVSNLFFNIPQRLSVLHPKQVEAISSIAFVADSRHFRKLLDWGSHPFGIPQLQLKTLTIVLHRSSFWHYLFDFTADIVRLLRNLRGVERLVFVRNAALVKGSLKTWYNRLVGLILKVDHQERYEKSPSNPETTWWKWSFDDMAQSFSLEALSSKPLTDEQSYFQQVAPLLDDLRISVENEEWNPDPRSRNMFY